MLGYRPHETDMMDLLSLRQMNVALSGWRRSREAEAAVFGRVLFGEGEGAPGAADPKKRAEYEARVEARGWDERMKQRAS